VGFTPIPEECWVADMENTGKVDALAISSLSVGYGSRIILQDISLNIRAGEVFALIGPNGAGKTTLIRSVSGVIPYAAGTVLVNGRNLKQLSPSQRATHLAVVPQARNLPDNYSVWQTVLMGRTPYLGWLGRPSNRDEERVAWALQRTETNSLADRRIGELSGGEQQRVLLARALAQDTPILLLDEPTAHLDLKHQSGLLALVRDLAHSNVLAVLMVLHDLNHVSLFADRVGLLVEGRLKAVGSPQQVLTQEILKEVYQVSLGVIAHPEYGLPLVYLDGQNPKD
jgi:iron complex transport system ATP-binding protein